MQGDVERLIDPTERAKGEREVETGLDESGLEPDRAVVVRDRLVVPLGAREREAETVVRRRRLRPELRGGAVLRDRLLEPALLAQRVAEIEPRRRVIRD